jgi:hypothetical protein
MWKKLTLSAFCLFLLLAVLHLGMRIHELEHQIEAIKNGGQGASHSQTNIAIGTDDRESAPKNSVRVIDATYLESTPMGKDRSSVGVPWEVERAMIPEGGRFEHLRPIQIESRASGTSGIGWENTEPTSSGWPNLVIPQNIPNTTPEKK